MLVGGVGGDSSTVQSVKLALCNHISLKTLLIWSIFNILSFSFSGKLNYLTLTDPSKVWMPDTFFRNEKEAKKHEIIVPNVYVRIYPNGDILYSIR